MKPFNKSALLLATASAATLAMAGVCQAQAADAGGSVEAVVVTGSRLQTGFAAPTPVTAVNAVQIQQRAPSQILEVIYDLPGVRMDSGPTQGARVQTGTGTTSLVNLRGLGSNRTLTLVNGRRQVATTPGGNFDSNRIPVGLVERVDVVTGGASAAYGSDAVAGVVNYILNDRLEGIRASAQYGVSELGDNEQWTANFAWGGGFLDDRAHVILGVDYSDGRGAGTIYTRPWGRLEPGLLAYPATRPAGVPAQVWSNNVELSAVTDGGIVTTGPLRGTAFAPNGTPYNFQFGTVLSNLMTGSTANLGNNPLGHFRLGQPVERVTTMVGGRYTVTDSIELFADFAYTAIKSSGQVGLTQIPAIIISSTNPFIPAATRAAMAATNQSTITLGWLGSGLNINGSGPAYGVENANYTTQGNIGAQGTIFGDWRWEAYWSHGVSRVDGLNLPKPHVPNFLAAVNVVTGPNGQPVCGPIATNPNLTAAQRALVLPGCVPYNIFGVNSASAEARAYAGKYTSTLNIVRQDLWAANISGTPFATWAGDVSLAVGGEYRHEAVSVRGEGIDASSFNFGGTQSYTGRQNITEGFAEIGVPLIKDQGIRALDLNGAIRRTHYQLSGGVTTWKFGATMDVTDDLRLRATRSRDIRAPNLFEQFQVGTRGTTNNVRNPFNNQTGQLFSQGGGNPNLDAEIGDTWTAGVVLQPTWDWARGFRASIDYYDIKIKGVVAGVGAVDTLNRCFQGQQQYCDFITFDTSPFGVALIRTSTYNLNQLATDGVDFELSYQVPALPVPGSLNVRLLGTYAHSLSTTDLTGVAVDRVGTGAGVPKWYWTANFAYNWGGFGAQLRARYFSSMKADINAIGPDDPAYSPTLTNSISKNLFPDMVYWSLAAQYDVREGIQLFGGIENLFDKQPPTYAPIAFSNQSEPYDVIGRQFRIGVRLTR